MSYDLYCYKSILGYPDFNEAESVISAEDESEAPNPSDTDRKNMLMVAETLVAFDPRLELFELDFDAIAKLRSISTEQARESVPYLEVNTAESEEHYVQFIISNDHVGISFGFGMNEEFMSRILEYVDVICRKTGYFLFDPQDGSVMDPLHPIALSREESTNWTDTDEVNFYKETKPWWKIW